MSSSDGFTISYKLCYRTEKWDEEGNPDVKGEMSHLLTNEKQTIQSLLNKLEKIELEDYNLMQTVQFLTLISELRYLDVQLLAKDPLFAELLSKLSNDQHMQKCLEAYKTDSNRIGPMSQTLISSKALENPKLSSLLNKVTADPVVLAAGMIPPSLSTIALNAEFLLEFDSRINYSKFGNESANRALHHIYQANRGKLKDLENFRVGKTKQI